MASIIKLFAKPNENVDATSRATSRTRKLSSILFTLVEADGGKYTETSREDDIIRGLKTLDIWFRMLYYAVVTEPYHKEKVCH